MTTVIRGGTVIDATGAPAMPDATVVIEGNIIKEVGPMSSIHSTSDAEVIDAKGKFLVPGLMDVHTHLCIPFTSGDPGSHDPSVTDESIALTAMYAVQNARNFVLKGITTVRDVGTQHHGIFSIKRLINNGQIVGPRVIACGRAIAMTGGHGMNVATSADGPDGVRKVAREELKAGADALKFMASGAGAAARQSPYDVDFTQEELSAGIREAHARGKTTCAHSMNVESTKNAVLAGIDSIEHGLLINEECLLLMRERGVHYVPTLWSYQNAAKNGALYGTEDSLVREVGKRVQTHLANVVQARELGVWISAGTDSGLPLNLKDSLFWELEWLTYCGLTPMEALRAATYNNAKLLRLDDKLGTLEPGKLADILIVDSDPLGDIRNLKGTDAVLKDGVICVRNGKLTADAAVRDLRELPDGPVPPPTWL